MENEGDTRTQSLPGTVSVQFLGDLYVCFVHLLLNQFRILRGLLPSFTEHIRKIYCMQKNCLEFLMTGNIICILTKWTPQVPYLKVRTRMIWNLGFSHQIQKEEWVHPFSVNLACHFGEIDQRPNCNPHEEAKRKQTTISSEHEVKHAIE